MTPVNSVAIRAIGYDVAANALIVEMVSGKTYRYAGVSPEMHAQFMAAGSKGKFYVQYIKPNYRKI